jgi:PAS domain S-box-containing protein
MELSQAHAILDVAHNAFISMDEEGRIAHWNPRAAEMFGLDRDDALGEVLADTIIPERYREAHWAGLRRFQQTGEGPVLNRRIELSALRADGSEFPVEMTISALAEDGGWTFHAFIADISARHDAERERRQLLDELERALHGSEQRLSAILNSLGEAVTIRGADDQLIDANRAALDRMGLASVEELREADAGALMGDWETSDQQGQAIAMADLPSVRVLRGEQPEPLLMRSVSRASGEESWVLLKATAVHNAAGEVDAAVTIIEDVTATQQASMRMQFLAQASHVLASSLDYQETLSNVAWLAVPQIADWCAVDLFDEDGGRAPVAVAHTDPAKIAMSERLREYEPEELDPNQGLGLLRRTGKPMLYSEIPDELLVEAAIDEEHLRLLREVGMRSALAVPMKGRTRTIGALTLVASDSGRTFGEGDLEFAEQVAQRAALAVENARLYTELSQVAQTLQRSLLPEALPHVPGWEVAVVYRPAGHGNEVGGDFYDLWEVEGDWRMMIGDVTGKGVGAAAVTSLVRHTAWAASDFEREPSQILARVDTALKRRPTLSLCTALCMSFSAGRGTIAAAGHPLPFHLTADGVREVGRHGPLLGAFDEASWTDVPFEMQPGETLVAFTDGVTDAVGAGDERFGSRRLIEVLGELRDEDPLAIRQRLVEALESFQVGAQADDTAVMVMRYVGTTTPS